MLNRAIPPRQLMSPRRLLGRKAKVHGSGNILFRAFGSNVVCGVSASWSHLKRYA